MKRFDMRILIGIVLIVAGSVFLLQNLGVFYGGVNLLGAIAIGSVGVTSLYFYANNRENWWALIPGTTLIAIALNIFLDTVFYSLGNILGGGIVLGGIALSFWLIYFTQRGSFWWAIIPAGALSSLAVVSVADEIFHDAGGIFLLGLGATFLFIANLPGYDGQLKWAYIPGWILIAIGIISLPFMGSALNILFPLALIAVGGYVLYRNFRE